MSACVTRIFLVEKVMFQIRTHLHHLIDSIVFFYSFQLTISARPKYIYICMLYKTKLRHDRCMLVSVIRADLQTEISKSWHVNW